MRFVTALPADPQDLDPLDPERILRELPEQERERENFLSQYRGLHPAAERRVT
jgi:hypothetical protein